MNTNGQFFAILIVLFLLTTGTLSGLCADAVQPEGVNNSNCELPVLNMYTWVEYIDPAIFSDFEKEFHVKVNIGFYSLEDEMFSSIQSEPGRYDIVFPSESSMDVMIKSKLLSKFDTRRIPNARNLKAKFRTIINRKWKGYCVPIDWGVTGIAYNTKYVREPVDSWDIFWNTKYKGYTALVDDPFEVLSVGLKRLHYPLNPACPGDMNEPVKLLKELKPLLQDEGFIPYNRIREKLKSEGLWLAQCYNGDAAILNEENNQINFVIPKEGTSFWIDVVAIPFGAKNKQLAETFIDYMLRPEIGARHTNYSYYANCNKKAWRFVNKEKFKNPYVYIRRKEIDRLELYETLSPDIQKKLNEYWAELVSN